MTYQNVTRNIGLAAILGLSLSGAAEADCRLALALALDVSGSVDLREYRLQLDGVAAALETPSVRAALLALPSAPVELLVYEWSGIGDHHVVIDWTEIGTPEDINTVQDQLRKTQRRASSPGTALGDAMSFGLAKFATRTECWHQTLDVSGDGKSNLGPAPQPVRDLFIEKGIAINALVVGADSPTLGVVHQTEIAELSSYYRVNVIAGKDAFVQTALGYDGYAKAMARKLERELRHSVFSELPDSYRLPGKPIVQNQ